MLNGIQFYKLLPNKFGIVNTVAISKLDTFIAFSTLKGYVVVISIEASQVVASENNASIVTCFYWNDDESQLFYGSKSGQISLINLKYFMVSE